MIWRHRVLYCSLLMSPLLLVLRWTPTIVQAVWRTCHLQRLSWRRTGETNVQMQKASYNADAGHCWLCICLLFVLHHINVIHVLNLISYHPCSAVGVQIVSIAHVACTHCLREPPTSQLLCPMTLPRRPWRRPTTWLVASVAGPQGMWEWLTNQSVGADVDVMWFYCHYFKNLDFKQE